MAEFTFHLLGDLPSLAGKERGEMLARPLPGPASVKDCLEAAGIPHTEVDLLLVGGEPVSFSYLVHAGDAIEVHPVPPASAASSDGANLSFPDARLQNRPLAWDRFACDQHLGKLARLLRMLGFDTAYHCHWLEPEIAECAICEERAILTCSRALLKWRRIDRGRLIRSRQVDTQAVEVVRRFGLAGREELFGRCSVCNGELRAVAKESVAERIPPQTLAWRDNYHQCRQCQHLYWEGTHVARLKLRFAGILAAAGEKS